MNADQIRAEIRCLEDGGLGQGTSAKVLRSWLALYDEATVEKVAKAMYLAVSEAFGSRHWFELEEETKDIWRSHARRVVAAITEGEA